MNDPRPPEGYWLNAVVPLGPAKAELLKLLREAEPTTYSQVCRDFAVMRAQELCLTYTNDELAVRDGLFVWTVYNFELVTCLRRVLAKTKWRHIWTIISEAQCAFVDEVEKIRQRRCAQHFISESPAPSWDVCCAPAALPAHQENIMTEGNIIRLRVAPWIEQGKVYVESAPGTVVTRPMEDALIALAAAVLEADGQTRERDHDGAVGLTIFWKDSAWKPVGA